MDRSRDLISVHASETYASLEKIVDLEFVSNLRSWRNLVKKQSKEKKTRDFYRSRGNSINFCPWKVYENIKRKKALLFLKLETKSAIKIKR